MAGEPRALVAHLTDHPALPHGSEERFAGFGVMGLPFGSGHVLALRCFIASSVGPGYTSVWHRAPDSQWTIYSDVAAAQSCPRYFGAAVAESVHCEIEVQWTGPRSLRVGIGDGAVLDWSLALASTLATRAMNSLARLMPDPAWRRRSLLALMSRLAGPVLGIGSVTLMGNTPNGQRFIANPQHVWLVSESQAALRGRDLGPPGPVVPQAQLGDFRIPQRGMFALGRSFFEPFDPIRHSDRVSRRA